MAKKRRRKKKKKKQQQQQQPPPQPPPAAAAAPAVCPPAAFVKLGTVSVPPDTAPGVSATICAQCSAGGATTVCGRCKRVRYCSRACQVPSLPYVPVLTYVPPNTAVLSCVKLLPSLPPYRSLVPILSCVDLPEDALEALRRRPQGRVRADGCPAYAPGGPALRPVRRPVRPRRLAGGAPGAEAAVRCRPGRGPAAGARGLRHAEPLPPQVRRHAIGAVVRQAGAAAGRAAGGQAAAARRVGEADAYRQ